MALSEKCKNYLANVARSARNLFNNDRLDPRKARQAFTDASYQAAVNPSLRESFASIVRNNYLSATSTFLKNLGGNFGRLLEMPLTRLTGGRPGEAADILVGYGKAFFKVFPRFMAGFGNRNIEFDGRTGRNMDVYFKLPGVSEKNLELINRPINAIATFPQSVQRGVDEGFATLFEQAQYEVLKNRMKNKMPDSFFAKYGLDRDTFVENMDEIVKTQDELYAAAMKSKNPEDWAKVRPLWQAMESFDPFIASQIEDFSRYGTFRSRLGDSLIDQGTRKLSEMASKSPELALIVPFVVTPTNIAKFGFGFVPGIGLLRARPSFGNLLTKGRLVMKDIQKLEMAIAKKESELADALSAGKEGAAERITRKLADLEGKLAFERDFNRDLIGQQILGLGFVASAYYMKSADLLTGELSSDPGKRAVQEAAGMQPNSFKIGGNWVSYAGIEPLHTVLSMTATAMDQIKEGMLKGEDMTERMFRVGNVIKAGFLNKTFTEQLSNMFMALQSDSPERAQAFLVQMSNGITPNILNQFARIEDPVRREVKDPELSTWILNNMKSRIPFMRSDLPIQYNILGDPRALPNTISQLTGFPVSDANRNNVQILLNNPQLAITRPSDEVAGVKLTPQQYERLSMLSGNMAKILLEGLAESEGFMSLPQSIQAKFIKDYMGKFRSDVRLSMLPELIDNPEQRELYILNEMMKQGLNPNELADE